MGIMLSVICNGFNIRFNKFNGYNIEFNMFNGYNINL